MIAAALVVSGCTAETTDEAAPSVQELLDNQTRDAADEPALTIESITRAITVDGVEPDAGRLRLDRPNRSGHLATSVYELSCQDVDVCQDAVAKAVVVTALNAMTQESVVVHHLTSSPERPFVVEHDLELPELDEGLHCLVQFTFLELTDATGTTLAEMDAHGSRAIEIKAGDPSHCDLLAGATRIPDDDLELRREGPDLTCGHVRLLSEETGPVIEVSSCPQPSLVVLVETTTGAYHALEVPASELNRIVAFPFLSEPLRGTWQPILIADPDELYRNPSWPSHAVSSWPPVDFDV